MKEWYLQGDALLEEIRQTVTADREIAFWFLGQCGFLFKHGSKILMIDPVLNDITGPDGSTRRNYDIPFTPEQLEPDYVLCTHGHIDHLAEETARAIARSFPNARYVIPAGCRETARALGLAEEALIPLCGGSRVTLPGTDITVDAVSAAHPTHISDKTDPGMALGYCVSFGGIRVMHLGDTYLTEQLLTALTGMDFPHIFLPPINGDDRFRAMRDCIGNMEAEEAAKLAIVLSADLSIPTHYDMIQGNTVDPLRFAAELLRLDPAAKWHLPALGERMLYRL